MNYIYLASRSPRRRELLKQMGVRFEPLMLRLSQPRGPDLDEAQHRGETPEQYVQRVAFEKTQFGLRSLSMRSLLPRPVLSADTVVILDDQILGKPANASEASEFMRQLSGRTHEVRTCVGVGMWDGQGRTQVLQATSITQVTFRKVSVDEIDRYCTTSEPYDKAGGYAIQGLAAVFVERLEGSYSGVVGLPIFETAQLLSKAGFSVL
ncbi:MAG TPA: nucleoside triphosphate pyrophosphatase [Burkholderiaceae bacterium]|nr:nucleoside triphosphate pyrophosphatase [Burkholderiaceae bacterium]